MSRKVQQHSHGGPEVFEVVDVPVPGAASLGPGQVLVRVRAAGVNPVDAQTRGGGGVSSMMGAFPFTVGWDLAGTVAALGPDAGGLSVGERVMAFTAFPHQGAAYAEHAVVAVADLARVPDAMSDQEAGALPLAGLTAYQNLVEVADIQPGQRVLVQGGGGGVGHLAVQIAHALGAHVITTASAGKAAWLTGLGADQVVDHTSIDVAEVLRESVDVVLDTVSGAVGLSSVAVTRPGGLVIELLGVSEATRAAADAAGVRVQYTAVHTDGAQLRHLADMVEAEDLAVTVSEVFSLEQAAQAHRAIEGGHTRGKIVLVP